MRKTHRGFIEVAPFHQLINLTVQPHYPVEDAPIEDNFVFSEVSCPHVPAGAGEGDDGVFEELGGLVEVLAMGNLLAEVVAENGLEKVKGDVGNGNSKGG